MERNMTKNLDTRTATEARVLAWCNEVRAELGLEPRDALVPGVCDHVNRCVVANTIGADSPLKVCVSEDSFCAWGRTPRPICDRKPPPIVRDFIEDFDAGCYPYLIAEATP